MTLGRAFDRLAGAAAAWLARPAAFVLAVASVLAWGAAGPWCQWSEGWLLIGNTGMSIVSYLALFLILGAGARESAALHAKLDELISALPDARNELIAAEEMVLDEIAALRIQGAPPS